MKIIIKLFDLNRQQSWIVVRINSEHKILNVEKEENIQLWLHPRIEISSLIYSIHIIYLLILHPIYVIVNMIDTISIQSQNPDNLTNKSHCRSMGHKVNNRFAFYKLAGILKKAHINQIPRNIRFRKSMAGGRVILRSVLVIERLSVISIFVYYIPNNRFVFFAYGRN